MIKEYDLRAELDSVAKDIADFSSNPNTWSTWILYLLNNLEQQALDVNPSHQEYYEDMLSLLQDLIRNRLRTGGW
jgi:hypothetical protein